MTFTAKDLPAPLEGDEQRWLFEWAGANAVAHPDLKWLYAIPNGEHRNIVTAVRLKAQGVKPGVPDVALDVARGGWFGIRVELKRRKGSRTSAHQEAWHRRLWSQHYKVVVALGWEAAAAELTAYLALPVTRVVVAA